MIQNAQTHFTVIKRSFCSQAGNLFT